MVAPVDATDDRCRAPVGGRCEPARLTLGPGIRVPAGNSLHKIIKGVYPKNARKVFFSSVLFVNLHNAFDKFQNKFANFTSTCNYDSYVKKSLPTSKKCRPFFVFISQKNVDNDLFWKLTCEQINLVRNNCVCQEYPIT